MSASQQQQLSAGWEHSVQVYREPEELVRPVAAYLAEGLAAGRPAIVVATPEHRGAIAERLGGLGLDAAALEANGLLIHADAAVALAAIMDGDGPSGRRFEQVVGALLDRAEAAAPGVPPRVFGEMVDLLCLDGRPGAAAALEALWNRLGARRSFSLLCGYRVDLFDRQAQLALVPQICRSHSHVLPVDDPERFDRAVDAALAHVLGADAHKVYALVATQAAKGRVPASQLALTWISANMPRLAERVLESARAQYLEPATP